MHSAEFKMKFSKSLFLGTNNPTLSYWINFFMKQEINQIISIDFMFFEKVDNSTTYCNIISIIIYFFGLIVFLFFICCTIKKALPSIYWENTVGGRNTRRQCSMIERYKNKKPNMFAVYQSLVRRRWCKVELRILAELHILRTWVVYS